MNSAATVRPRPTPDPTEPAVARSTPEAAAVEPVAVAQNPRPALWTVQLFRASAALMVVIGHSQSAVGVIKRDAALPFARSTLLPWGASVDLFFVISGFIMVYASRRLFAKPGARRDFVERRLARIVPLYWVVTGLFIALLLAATLKGGDRFPSAAAILASVAFVPFDTWGDTRAFPVFDLGWTLNYEMFFYVLFAFTVSLPRRRAVATVAAVLLLLVALGAAVPRTQVALHFWTRPILLDFALGMGVGLALSDGMRLARPFRLMLALAAFGVLALDPTGLFRGSPGTTVDNGFARVLVAGLPSAVLLAAAVLGPEPRLRTPLIPLARLGDASYSLYLVHPLALIVLEKGTQKSAAVATLPGGMLVLATVAAAIALALGTFRWIERPLTAAIAARLDAARVRFPTPRSITQEKAA